MVSSGPSGGAGGNRRGQRLGDAFLTGFARSEELEPIGPERGWRRRVAILHVAAAHLEVFGAGLRTHLEYPGKWQCVLDVLDVAVLFLAIDPDVPVQQSQVGVE